MARPVCYGRSKGKTVASELDAQEELMIACSSLENPFLLRLLIHGARDPDLKIVHCQGRRPPPSRPSPSRYPFYPAHPPPT
jgi:hypothetical protein